MRSLFLLPGAILVAVATAHAGSLSLQVTATPKVDEDKRKLNQEVAVGELTGFYRVKVANLSIMADTPPLTAKYLMFVRRDDGKTQLRAIKPQRVGGESAVPVIKHGDSMTFDTSAVKLKKTSLDPGYYYTNNQRQTTKDELVGIWVQVFLNDQKVAEFLSSSTLPKYGPF